MYIVDKIKEIRKWEWYKLAIFMWIFFTIYSVNFSFLPMPTSRILALFSIAYIIYIIVLKKYIIPKFTHLKVPILVFYVYLMWVFFRTGVTGFIDTNLFTNACIQLVEIVPNIIFVSLISIKYKLDWFDLLDLVLAAIVAQGLFIWISFFSDSFKVFTLSIIPPSGNIDPLSPHRVRGLTHGSSATLSVLQSLGIYISTFLLIMRKKRKIFYILVIMILFISIILTGRTGHLIIVPIIFVLVKTKSIKNYKSFLAIPIIIVLFLTIFMLIYAMMGSKNMAWGEDVLARILRNFTSEFYYNDVFHIIPRTVTKLLSKHMFLPSTFKMFLLGDPRTYSVYSIPSDIGVIRRIFGVGLIGLFLSYGYIIFLFKKTIDFVKDTNIKVFLNFLLMFLLFIELKEPFVTKIGISYIYMYMLISLNVLTINKNLLNE